MFEIWEENLHGIQCKLPLSPSLLALAPTPISISGTYKSSKHTKYHIQTTLNNNSRIHVIHMHK